MGIVMTRRHPEGLGCESGLSDHTDSNHRVPKRYSCNEDTVKQHDPEDLSHARANYHGKFCREGGA